MTASSPPGGSLDTLSRDSLALPQYSSMSFNQSGSALMSPGASQSLWPSDPSSPDNGPRPIGAAADSVARMPSGGVHVDLARCGLNAEGAMDDVASAFVQSVVASSLPQHSLSWSGFVGHEAGPGASLASPSMHPLPTVTYHLDLQGNVLTDAAVPTVVSTIAACPAIVSVDLRGNCLSEEGCAALALALTDVAGVDGVTTTDGVITATSWSRAHAPESAGQLNEQGYALAVAHILCQWLVVCTLRRCCDGITGFQAGPFAFICG